MKVLVAYASRHGATRGIAERVATTLERNGLAVTLKPAGEVRDAGTFDAFVIGGAAYVFHWLKEATEFVERHRPLLASRPVWLFSSGPVGTDTVDAQGRDVLQTSVPREFAELTAIIHPRGERIFFGAYDPTARPIGFMERVTRMMPAARDALPAGDFRDWAAIEEWAEGIAHDLLAASAGVAPAG
jgi:menaquinone-dependent protoporphyrinogen oxidase